MSPFLGTRGAGSNRAFGYAGAAAPAQVTGLTATDFGTSRAYNNGRIDLSWSTPANNGATISGYKIERSTDNSTYSTLVANTGSATTTYSDTSLLSNQIYYYKVSAINAAGTGLASTAANATSTTVPQAPTIGTATAGNAQATVTYTANATGGKAVSTFTATSSPSGLTGTGASPITVTGLTNGTAYTFTVTATNANGTSAASAASNSVTPVLKAVVTGGTLSSDATYYYRSFTSNGTLTVANVALTTDILVVAGGGQGGTSGMNYCGCSGTFGQYPGGGGGAGGYITASPTIAIGSHTVTIGAGGNSGSNTAASGSPSSLSSTSASGGGRGAGLAQALGGGSGGGGARFRNPGTPATYGSQGAGSTVGGGNNGGIASGGSYLSGAGGGGAGAAGTGVNSPVGGAGGVGSSSSSSFGAATGLGQNVGGTYFFAGGGGGSGCAGAGAGGSGGGAAGRGGPDLAGIAGQANTGGGGGAAYRAGGCGFTVGGAGGSGVVIVRYTRSQVE